MSLARSSLSASCAALLLLPACSTENVSGGHRFSIIEEAGIPTAVTEGGPRFEGELFRYEHILTLQEDPANVESLLSRPVVFNRDEAGRYHVLDPTQGRIAVFDPEGRYLHTYGRKGDGPGEFRSPALQYVRKGVVSIWDYTNARTTRFTSGGELIDTVRKPLDFEYNLRGLFHTGTGGLVGIQPFAFVPDSTWVKCRMWNGAGDILATIETPLRIENVRRSIPGSDRTRPVYIPYGCVPSAAYHSDLGTLVSSGHEPVLTWYDDRGDPTRRIRIPCLNNTLTDADRERYDRLWSERRERFPERAGEIRVYGDPALLPDRKACWTYIHIDDAGYLWLRTSDPIYFDLLLPEGQTYHLLDREGGYLGITRTPQVISEISQQVYLTPVSVADGYFMGISQDPETGANLMKVYRMVPVAEGFRYP